jgi:hypothetical protein
MTRAYSPDGDDSGDQSDEYSERFETIETKAREALKHDDPGTDCDVTVRAHNRDYDSDRGVTDHLIRTDDEWIAVRTWSVVGGEAGLTVTDAGEHLVLDPPELDRECVFDRLVRGALDAIDNHEAAGQPVKPFTALVRCAAAVAEDLVAEWEAGSDRVVKKRLHEGVAGWTGHTAWTALEAEAIYLEADLIATRFIDEHVTCDVSDDVEATIQNICEAALFDGVSDLRNSQTAHIDYAAEVTLFD